MSLVAGLLPALILAAAPQAGAQIPNGVGFTQEGCNNPGGLTLPIAGKFICPDADYTTGNLGKNWSELDLVPLRVTISGAGSTTSFSFAVAVDNTNSGKVGYDVLSAPVLNTDPALSGAGCAAPTVGAQTTANGELLRLVTVTIPANQNCVYDYYARLAIGAHLYPGSSLHANLADDLTGSTSGIGTKAVSINPKDVAAQTLQKDMTATQDTDHVWNVTKSPSPASLDFANTCDPAGSLSQNLAVTVSWTKQAATPSSAITIVTHVYATNPSTRTITISVSDQIYSGTTAVGSPITGGPIDVPANTQNALIINSTTTVPSGTTNINDIATGSYVDSVTQLSIPSQTTATATATIQPGSEHNASASISDVESIAGSGLSFSTNSFSGASGSFGGGYVAGTHTSGSVSWTSASQSTSGSVTFQKTVYATSASVASGVLDDTATLFGADGFTTDAPLSVDIDTNAATSLTVSKDQTLSFMGPKTYTFHVFDAATDTDTGKTATVTIPAGQLGPITSSPVTGLSATGAYYVKEDATAPFGPQTSTSGGFTLVAGNASSCTEDFPITNDAEGAHARVQKTTAPTSSGDWTFTLTGPNGLNESLTVVANAGYLPFQSALDVDGGTYTITETPQTGYDLTSVSGDVAGAAARVSTSTSAKTCSFTLNLTTDADHTLSCTFGNTQRGTIIVKKVTDPVGAPGLFAFTGDAAGSIGDGGTITVNNLVPGTYTSTESDPTPNFDLTGISCNDGGSATASSGSVATRTATFKLDPGETVTCTFTNRERGHIIVKKVTQPSGSTQSFTFTPSYNGGQTFNLMDGGANDSGALAPGTYSVAEGSLAGWDQTSAVCDNADDPSSITLAAGATVTCTFTNVQRGHIIIEKLTAPSSPQSFTFTPSYNGGQTFNLSNGQSNDSGGLRPGNYSVAETAVAGWDPDDAPCDNGDTADSITLAPGATVTCVFTNTQRGTIIVKKVTDPIGAPGSFTFTGDAAGTIGSGGSIVVSNLKPGTYTSTESGSATGFDLTGLTCDDAGSATPSSGDVATGTATFHLDPGETVTCTFTNTERATINVKKLTNPTGAAGSFTFTGDAAGTIGSGGTITVNNLVPGTYTSTESDPTPGFDLTNIACDDADSSGALGTRTATFHVSPGETVTCTFTNTQRGTIIVKKLTNPAGAAGNFTFTGDAAGTITSGGTITVNNLVPGTYTSTESNPAPAFDLTDLSCNDAASATASSGTVGTRTATFHLDPGETVTCTFTNTQRGTIIVKKLTNPAGAAGNFTFTGDAAGTITSGGTITVTNVAPGTYTSTESDPAPAFDLTSLSCNDAASATPSSGNLGTRTATFHLDPAETVTCTFTNTQRGTIIVKKVTSPTGAPGSFTFTGDAAGSIGDGGTITVPNLVPGTYTSTESNPAPTFDLTGLSCNDAASATPSIGNLGTRTATFHLDPGETVTCTFTNTQRATIIVKKLTNPAGAAGSFVFTGTAAGTIGSGGTITVNNLTPGTYTSAETNPSPAFDLTGLSCNDAASATPSSGNLSTRTATFHLDPGETVTCTFTNTQRGKATVVKTVSGLPPSGTQSFTFQLRQGASPTAAGSVLESLTANAGNHGVLNFNTPLVPGAPGYQLCEQMMVGWDNNFASLFSVYNPNGDNSVVCTDFTVTAGQTVTFNVDNTPPPGGLALTIGFWKNWSSCSGGKQQPTLDKALLAAANAGHPITLGLLVLNPNALGAATACKDAVNVLNRTTIDGKTKKASDPLFNMAAQLLAADLNGQAGAGTCGAATTAINSAHALLAKYSWNGLTYSPKLTAADATTANNLNNALNKYNNNLLC